jgi:hypothetical protein
MSRTAVALPTYTPGADTPVTIDDFLQPAKDNVDLLLLGVFARNVNGGGSETVGLDVGVGTGFVRAIEQIEIEIDNTGNQVSAAANLVCQVRVCVRVANAAISVTPRVYNVTDASVPTGGTGVACSATAADFSGTNQQQTISFTLAAGKKKYIVQIQKSVDIYQAFCSRIAWNCYVNG